MKKLTLAVILLTIFQILNAQTQKFELSPFDKITISLVSNVYIHDADRYVIVIKDSVKSKVKILIFDEYEQLKPQNQAYDLLEKIDLKIIDNELFIEAKNVSLSSDRFYIEIGVPSLKQVTVESVSQVKIGGELDFDKLEVNLEGAAVFKITDNVFIDTLKMTIEGASIAKIETPNPIHYAQIKIEGASVLTADQTEIKNLDITIEGTAVAKINVTDSLKALAEGISVLKYKGSPTYQKVKANGLAVIKEME